MLASREQRRAWHMGTEAIKSNHRSWECRSRRGDMGKKKHAVQENDPEHLLDAENHVRLGWPDTPSNLQGASLGRNDMRGNHKAVEEAMVLVRREARMALVR